MDYKIACVMLLPVVGELQPEEERERKEHSMSQVTGAGYIHINACILRPS